MQRKTTLQYGFFTLSIIYAWVMTTTYASGSLSALTGLIIPKAEPPAMQWVTIDEDLVASGATIPRHTNVIFHVPAQIDRIERSVLFGHLPHRQIRYWGYCFPDNYDANTVTPGSLPGKVFLSEAERAWRRQRERENKPLYTVFRPPSRNELHTQTPSRIRHQVEIFTGGMSCYIMTNEPLSIGSDDDGDRLNILLEKQFRTDPRKQDTDEDGIADGLELLSLQTDPLRRDSDGDGIIDGIEDRNQNGRIDEGETNPTQWDSDGDALCDGYCQVRGTKRICADFEGRDCVDLPYTRWRGEDKNLNGILDEGETNPLKADSDDDGILDEQEYYNCILARKTNC